MATTAPGAPLINYGTTEGPFLIGVMVSCALFGITCAQTAYYYRTYPGDHVYRKILVATLFVLETAHLFLVSEAAHFFYVIAKQPENLLGMFLIRKSFAVSFGLTVIITSLVQAFYGWRVYSISNLHKWRKFAVGLIALTSFVQFGFGVACDTLLFVNPNLTSVHEPTIQALYSTQLAGAMACDLFISLSLVHFLNRSRSGFNSTENIIDRLIIYSVNVGLVTAAMSICTFVTFHTLLTSTMFTLFTEIISKIYVNSLLVTLNSRNSIKSGSTKRPMETIPLSGTGFSQTRVRVTDSPQLSSNGKISRV
ncbi:hypothetical protein FPV67DRAFT_1111484 [Lyophyllum atratum]|nr:hypothetical protein FPV67DRAFT_1111484 [Lyophyllum atratum]